MSLCLHVTPHMATVWNLLWIITKHKTGRNPTQDELITSFVTVSWLKCSMQNIISSSTWRQITGLNLKCIVNYVVFGLKPGLSSAVYVPLPRSEQFAVHLVSLCCKSTVFVYTGCEIKLWSESFIFVSQPLMPICAIIQERMWKRREAVRQTESRRELSQMKTAVSWDGEGQRLRRKTTGVESGISNNRKRLLHTHSDMQASGTLFERWWQPDTFTRSAALC